MKESDELDQIEEPVLLNTSVCRMCLYSKDRRSLILTIGPGGVSVRCPNGNFAPLNKPAPDTCLYLLEHTLIGEGSVPLPIVDGDDM